MNIPDPVLRARDIALRSIHGNIARHRDKSWILAGGNHYRCLWTRDMCMAVSGVLIAGENPAVRHSLEELFQLRDKDGQVPRAIDVGSVPFRVILASLGYHRKFKPPFKGSFKTENGVHSIDGNLILPWAASRYVLTSRDFEFAKKYFDAAQSCLSQIESKHLHAGLIGGQPPFSDWADSLKREGFVAWTNLLHWLALSGLRDWALALGFKQQAALYRDAAHRTGELIIERFWDEELGMLRSFNHDRHLSADVNLLAIATHLLDPVRGRRALDTLRASPLWRPIPGAVTFPDYPASMKSWVVKFFGLRGYHDNMVWVWISALGVRAHLALGDREEAQALTLKIAELICQHSLISEVYEPMHDRRTGVSADRLVPVKRIFYTSETPFTWSSAMFLEALTEAYA